jgi:hypothetical protein
MRDTELYRHLLGLESPWTVAKVDLSVSTQRVDVFVEHPQGQKWPCPVCGDLLPVHDRQPVILYTAECRTWLDRENTDPAPLVRLYQPYPAELMQAYIVSCQVNAVRNQGRDLIQPADHLTLL